MPGAKWYSQPDRPKQTFGHFDSTPIADDYTRWAFERIHFELTQLNRGWLKPIYDLRAHCWMPDVTCVMYGANHAHFNTTYLSAKLRVGSFDVRKVWLPDANLISGGYVEIVDWTGDAATTPIRVATIKGQKMYGRGKRGSESFTIDQNHAVVCFRSDGETWRIVSMGNVGADDEFTADNRLARTNRPSVNNRKIQSSGVTLDDSDNMSGIAALTATTGTFDNAVFTGTITFPGGYYITAGPSGGIGFFDDGDNLLAEIGTAGGGTHVTGKLDVDGDVDPESITLEVVEGLSRPSERRIPTFKRDAKGKYVRDPETGKAIVESWKTKPVASLYFRKDGRPCIHLNGKTIVLAVESIEDAP